MNRVDDQVKINGFRVELAEIEAVYEAHSSVEKAVAVVREGQLVAYLKGKGAGLLSDADIMAINVLSNRSLTHYMQPKYAPPPSAAAPHLTLPCVQSCHSHRRVPSHCQWQTR